MSSAKPTANQDRAQAALWEQFAAEDLRPESGERAPVEYVARNILGSLLLAVARRRVFSYAEADVPKLTWLKKALAGTGEHLLDVGVRTGDLARFFKEHGKRVYGIDIASTYVEHCVARGIIAGGAVCNVERDEIPAPSAQVAGAPDLYDVVFIGEVLEHLLDGRKVLKKLAAVIRPGGHLILTTPNLAYLGNRIRLLFGRDLHTLTIDRGEVGNQHIRVYTTRLLTRLLADAGMEVVGVGSDGVPVKLNRFVQVRRKTAEHSEEPPLMVLPFTASPIPQFGRTIFLIAVKVG